MASLLSIHFCFSPVIYSTECARTSKYPVHVNAMTYQQRFILPYSSCTNGLSRVLSQFLFLFFCGNNMPARHLKRRRDALHISVQEKARVFISKPVSIWTRATLRKSARHVNGSPGSCQKRLTVAAKLLDAQRQGQRVLKLRRSCGETRKQLLGQEEMTAGSR